MEELQALFNPEADRVIASQHSFQLVLENSSVKDSAGTGQDNSDETLTTERLSNQVIKKDQVVNNDEDSSPI